MRREREIGLIEDAAHAPGASVNGKKCGTFGDVGCFSFFSNKNLSIGEGGMVSIQSPDLHQKLGYLRSHGMTTLTLDRHKGRAITYDVMLKDSPSIGTGTVTMKNDPRVLPAGKFLRKTKINELPQLLNVFMGHMSLVGPRSQAPRCFDAFPVEAQNIIVQVKPGLSGIGPIVFRGEEDILEGYSGTLDFYDNVIGPYKGDVEA
jgi:hypothetical protein